MPRCEADEPRAAEETLPTPGGPRVHSALTSGGAEARLIFAGMAMKALRGMTAMLGALLLGGCLAKTALDVATAPVRVASKAVDLATTSQSEADEKRGREIRRREERLGQLEREHNKQAERCAEGNQGACHRAELARAEIEQLLPTLPVERPQ